eukprot:TRINITY_DN2433_c0_g1_i1.p1 TRINITY_DN2433_c0_g1~~TRINITY_DN2433_c0_g1_i1.p1  ORF type:complete len:249 (-),score=49.98 TRINITY_DN2433_c0_g1_i1:66-812(-)
MADREEYVFMARIAESCDRYEDMSKYTKHIVEMGTELTADERNLLSVSYKSSVATHREAFRHVKKKLMTPQFSESARIKEYYIKIAEQFSAKCQDLLSLLGNYLIAGASDNESKVFYLKMKGDYCRYLAELAAGMASGGGALLPGLDGSGERAQEAYSEAWECASSTLDPTHAVRLGLALNYSVFFYEVSGLQEEATRVARESLDLCKDQALSAESESIVQLIQDNIRLWAGGANPHAEQDGTNVEDM